MRDLRTDELGAVSGGTFGKLFSFRSWCKPQPAYCAPKRAPKCEPKYKPRKGC